MAMEKGNVAGYYMKEDGFQGIEIGRPEKLDLWESRFYLYLMFILCISFRFWFFLFHKGCVDVSLSHLPSKSVEHTICLYLLENNVAFKKL